MFNDLANSTEKSYLGGLLGYFRILNGLIILFLLFICMNYVLNQDGESSGGNTGRFQFR